MPIIHSRYNQWFNQWVSDLIREKQRERQRQLAKQIMVSNAIITGVRNTLPNYVLFMREASNYACLINEVLNCTSRKVTTRGGITPTEVTERALCMGTNCYAVFAATLITSINNNAPPPVIVGTPLEYWVVTASKGVREGVFRLIMLIQRNQVPPNPPRDWNAFKEFMSKYGITTANYFNGYCSLVGDYIRRKLMVLHINELITLITIIDNAYPKLMNEVRKRVISIAQGSRSARELSINEFAELIGASNYKLIQELIGKHLLTAIMHYINGPALRYGLTCLGYKPLMDWVDQAIRIKAPWLAKPINHVITYTDTETIKALIKVLT
jgi:hypothetical protein